MSRSRWTRVTVAVGFAVAIALAAYAAGGGPLGPGTTSAPGGEMQVQRFEVVQARRFELVDAQGKVYAALSFGEPVKRPVLEMYDETGERRAALFVGPHGPALDLYYQGDGRPALMVRATQDSDHHSVSLVLSCRDDDTAAIIQASTRGGATLRLRDERGRSVWSRP